MSITFHATIPDPTVAWGTCRVRAARELADLDAGGFNLSNTNAHAFLRLLEIDPEPCGSIPIATMVRAVQRARASFDYRVDALVTKPAEYKVPNGPRVIVFGNDPDYFERRLSEFAELLTEWIERGATDIGWS